MVRNSRSKKLSLEAKKYKKKTKVLIRTRQLTQLNYSGAGKLKIDDFTVKNVQLNLEGAIASTIQINCQQFELNVEGVSSHNLTGSTDNFEVSVEGANSINARKFKTKVADIDIEGTNSASFWVTDDLAIQLDGLNSVSYRGEPAIEKTVSITSNLKKE